MNCEECGAPCEVAWSSTAVGVDYGPPNDAIFEIQRIQCAAGHWYTRSVLVAKIEDEEVN